MSSITEMQADYIKILSSYDYSKKEDEADIANFLKEQNKQEISQLSKWEASELIQVLLKQPTQYVFVCGRKAILDKQEVNGFNALGDTETCGYACPNEEIQGDINVCPDYKDQYSE